jgi:hypothetical protein
MNRKRLRYLRKNVWGDWRYGTGYIHEGKIKKSFWRRIKNYFVKKSYWLFN